MDYICRSKISFFIRGTRYSCNTLKFNTIPKEVISCTILKNFLAILNPLPINLGLHVTISTINDPLIIPIVPNGSSVSGYGHTKSKPVTIFPICGGEFLYLLSCSIVQTQKNIHRPTSNSHVIIPVVPDNFCV